MQDMVAEVASIVATVIGADVAADEPLMAAGLDSLGAVQLRNAITERFGVELPPTAALDFPTVLALACFVAQSVAPAAGALAAPLGGLELDRSAWSEFSGEGRLQGCSRVCARPCSAMWLGLDPGWKLTLPQPLTTSLPQTAARR